MESSKTMWISVLLAAVVLVILIFWPSRSQAPKMPTIQPLTPVNVATTYARIRSAAGSVLIKRDRILFHAVPAMALQAGDRVLTGPDGKADIFWPSFGHSLLNAGSVLDVLKAEGTSSTIMAELRLQTGRIWTRLQQVLGKESTFGVQASDVGALVRGTSFGVTASMATVGIQVTESKVGAVHLLDGFVPDGAETLVTAGQSLNVSLVPGKPSVFGKPQPLTKAEQNDAFVLEGGKDVSKEELNATSTPAEPSTKAGQKISAIEYQGRPLPMDQLQVEKPDTCDADHYHALKNKMVKAIDGTVVADPGGCGFGKVKETPSVEFEVR